MALAVIHQAPGGTSLPEGACLWRTCLREVIFLNGETGTDATLPVVRDEPAYALLLEIICGLRSPIVGETEVQAQFKTFLASLNPARHGVIVKTGQRLLTDAKHIRSHHLQGFGSRSYGYLAARHVNTRSRVVVVGTGALAAEILAALDASGHSAPEVWGRRSVPPPDLPIALARYFSFSAAVEGRGAPVEPIVLIVAAPVAASEIGQLLQAYTHIARVIDLRSVDERTPFAPTTDVVTLDDLFAEASAEAPPASERLDTARREIAARAAAYGRREELRPFGWDDLCA